ncbi:Uncharcterized protein, DUF927 family [Azotobacter beijerinckii]|uniref:Uncharcterized protein, DUF927 family n=1 Tax=Azotobacter beijerinckii TaxID=170623 RepID=A0A1H9I4G5_9GAMM|nr:DUF927 domain-containing protein [Azotobacter beijerinckii]SEQ69453.1 Uncharcterized protein, DUF927 family [Azotobacter beijerinckii]
MTGQKPKRPSFADVKAASLRAIEQVLAHWLPGGKRVDGGKEYTAPNPTRADKHAGSLKVNLAKGTWSDFATGDKGGDLIDLVRYLEHCTDVEACNRLADFLDVTAGDSTAPASKTKAPEWEPVLPIPTEAMAKVYKTHRQHGAPSKVWVYRDAEGRPLFVLYRFDLGPDADGQREKVFAPLTWCRNADGAHQWRWSGLPEPRPLLRLDELARRPGAPVVVCEGEKAADAAAELLPGHVATCWPNGSNSWHKADFAPLAGRDVLLWPDNDAPGLACMEPLAERLRELGAASVQVLALSVFNQRPGLDGDRPTFAPGGKWAEGDDAADAQSKGWTPAHLAELLRSGELFALTPATAPERQDHDAPAPAPAEATGKPASRSKRKPARSAGETANGTGGQPAGYKVTEAGVFCSGDDGEARHICSRLEILARTRDDKGHNWGLLVEFDDPDGAKKRLNIPGSAMVGEFGKDVVAPLVNMGLRMAPARSARNARNDLQGYLQAYDSPARARLVSRLGWHDSAYLLPDRKLGSSDEHLHFYEAGTPLPPIEQAGTLEQWQRQIGALCVGNHRLAFAVCVAFAGPLLHLVGQESGGFHFYGISSTGKSTTGRVACSVYGPPAFERSWRSTDNALESIAAAHSDGLLVLDEISQCDPRIVGETVYMLGNGTGKARANDRGQAGRQVQEWRLLFISSGEYTLAQHMAEANKELKAGMDIRMLAIPADAGKGHGLFDTLHGFDGGAALSEALKARVGRYYGTPLVALLSALCEPGRLDAYRAILRSTLERFVAEVLPASASGQAQRAAARFALAAAAGELATALGVTDWPEGTATAAARVCLDAWLAERGGAGNLESDAIVARLRLVVERYGESRFTRWESVAAKVDDHAPRTGDRLGFRRTLEHGVGDLLYTSVTYYFLSTAWRDEVFKGMNLRNVNRELIARGILEPDDNGKAAQVVALPGMPRTRAYVVSAAALLSDETDALAA